MLGRATAQNGFTLVEVLIAILVLAIGLLGLAMLQVEALKHSTDAYYRTQATMLAYEIVDRMRANSDAALNGDYISTTAPITPETCGDTASGCGSATALARYDLSVWYQNLSQALPAVSAAPSTIALVGTQATVTINWGERGITKTRNWTIEL